MDAVTPGYKLTDVGVIPEGWEVTTALDACTKIQDGTHFSPHIGGNDYYYVTSKNIRPGRLDLSSAARIDAKQHHAIYKRCDVKKGDLLLTKDGANTGNAAINTYDGEFSLLSSVAFLRVDSSRHSAEYFLQMILSSEMQTQIQEAMAGNAITRLTLAKINRLKFAVPPIAEQRAIAAALGDLDELIAASGRGIAKRRDLKQAAMQQLLTGRTRLPGFADPWATRKLGELASFQSGGTPRMADPTLWVGDVPWVSPKDMKVPRLHDVPDRVSIKALSNGTRLAPTGAIFIVIRGMILAHTFPVARCERPLAFNQDIKALITHIDVDSEFLLYWLTWSGPTILEICDESTHGTKRLPTLPLQSLNVLLPPLAEQRAIAAVLADFDAELEALEAERAKWRLVKQGAMQELLTGRTRLV